MAQLEHRHRGDQITGLGLQAAGSGGHFFDQCRVLLGGLVHLHNGFAHLAHAGALFGAGGADLAHQIGHLLD